MNSIELAINWIIDLIQSFAKVWSDLATPFIDIGDFEISFLDVFSLGVIVAVLVAKTIDILNPIG